MATTLGKARAFLTCSVVTICLTSTSLIVMIVAATGCLYGIIHRLHYLFLQAVLALGILLIGNKAVNRLKP